MNTHRAILVLAGTSLLSLLSTCHAQESDRQVSFQQSASQLVVLLDDQPIATYVHSDAEIPRPYLKDVRVPSGPQLTRSHPPIKGQDATDHADMHPGIWLAFGDLSGTDIWRNKGRVVHERFIQDPHSRAGKGWFLVRNRYETRNGELICHEDCKLTFLARKDGFLILWDSDFSAEKEFTFGDQEEMGLGMRPATPIAVKSKLGGRILDDEGRRNEKQIWGRIAKWCDYSGLLDDVFAGITLMPAPDNFRPCRWHARDYGFVAANPFGQKVFQAGDTSRVTVSPGKPLRLNFGIRVHANAKESGYDIQAGYRDYLSSRAINTSSND